MGDIKIPEVRNDLSRVASEPVKVPKETVRGTTTLGVSTVPGGGETIKSRTVTDAWDAEIKHTSLGPAGQYDTSVSFTVDRSDFGADTGVKLHERTTAAGMTRAITVGDSAIAYDSTFILDFGYSFGLAMRPSGLALAGEAHVGTRDSEFFHLGGKAVTGALRFEVESFEKLALRTGGYLSMPISPLADVRIKGSAEVDTSGRLNALVGADLVISDKSAGAVPFSVIVGTDVSSTGGPRVSVGLEVRF